MRRVIVTETASRVPRRKYSAKIPGPAGGNYPDRPRAHWRTPRTATGANRFSPTQCGTGLPGSTPPVYGGGWPRRRWPRSEAPIRARGTAGARPPSLSTLGAPVGRPTTLYPQRTHPGHRCCVQAAGPSHRPASDGPHVGPCSDRPAATSQRGTLPTATGSGRARGAAVSELLLARKFGPGGLPDGARVDRCLGCPAPEASGPTAVIACWPLGGYAAGEATRSGAATERCGRPGTCLQESGSTLDWTPIPPPTQGPGLYACTGPHGWAAGAAQGPAAQWPQT